MDAESEFLRGESENYKKAIRRKLIDFKSMLVYGNCQTSQAMAIYYGIFEDGEKAEAVKRLVEMIDDAGGHFDVGVLGARVIFHVLSEFGHSDLAFNMITREDYPSYGNWVKRGATTLWENFSPNDVYSMNHHFWGDVSAWFIKRVAGINLNPGKHNVNEVEISPSFIGALNFAKGYHDAPAGRISSHWRKDGDSFILELSVPEKIKATARLAEGFSFEDGKRTKTVGSGIYRIIAK